MLDLLVDAKLRFDERRQIQQRCNLPCRRRVFRRPGMQCGQPDRTQSGCARPKYIVHWMVAHEPRFGWEATQFSEGVREDAGVGLSHPDCLGNDLRRKVRSDAEMIEL